MAIINTSKPISGLAFLLGTSLSVITVPYAAYIGYHRLTSHTAKVSECISAEYQLTVNEKASTDLHQKEKLHPTTYSADPVMDGYHRQKIEDYYENSVKRTRDQYHALCPRSWKEDYNFYSETAPLTFFAALVTLSIAGIGLEVNRKKE